MIKKYKFSKTHREKIKENHARFWLGKKRPENSEEKHYKWKGGKVSYAGLHIWVTKKLGRPRYCAYCERTNLKDRQYHWANISHAYKRELSDWIRLCVSCHKKFDLSKIIL